MIKIDVLTVQFGGIKTGQVVETTGVRRSGDNIMGKIMVGSSPGEIGYPIAGIAKINFPEPAALPDEPGTVFTALFVWFPGLERPDARLKAAVAHGLTLCSADGDFARFPGLRWLNPLAQ